MIPKNTKKAGSLAVLAYYSLRPMTLRPILSDGLPLSPLNFFLFSFSIYKYITLYILFPKIAFLDRDVKFFT